MDEVLQNSPHRRVVRVGDTVRRPLHPWSPTIHALLQHLESVGFPYSPRFLGLDDEGREMLTYIDGDSGPDGWAPAVDEDGLAAMAVLLRDYHEAVADFRRRLQLFARAYAVSPTGLVDEMIAQQESVLDRTRLLAATGNQPQADWLAAGTVNDDNLRWSRAHRHLFEEA